MTTLTAMKQNPQAPAAGIYLWGDIDDASIVTDLLEFLYHSRRAAVLTVVGEGVRKSVYFREGSVIAASSDQPEDRFGDIMFRRGLITREQLQDALRQVGPGRKIGNVLLQSGAIDTSDLWKALRLQVEEIVCSILLFEIGHFTVARYDPAQVPTRTALETQHILLEGLRRKDELLHLRSQLPAGDRVLAHTGWMPSEPLPATERSLFELVDGRRTLDELLRASGLGAFGAARAIHHLLQVGAISAEPILLPGEAGGGGSSAGAIISGFNAAYARVHVALHAHGGHPFETGLQRFFRDADAPVAALFDNVEAGPDGRLPTDLLFANLKTCPVSDKLEVLRRGLNEYLRFVLFVAREALPYAQVERLAGEVRALVTGLSGVGA